MFIRPPPSPGSVPKALPSFNKLPKSFQVDDVHIPSGCDAEINIP
jgi:hypothetical protein